MAPRDQRYNPRVLAEATVLHEEEAYHPYEETVIELLQNALLPESA